MTSSNGSVPSLAGSLLGIKAANRANLYILRLLPFCIPFVEIEKAHPRIPDKVL